ncbi:21346_t:CDS:1 [Gigaspora margarita]|uniref:21346_t:CDS:1 n=2 Tax=Gigaspora margarita TaxID=4874 RepID=A0ABN7UPV6_GIGMA|nr:RNI-like protein [Gigaspora margarita]CAG8630444.1 21346_t:CDS:1 [Gigaspora margarita]
MGATFSSTKQKSVDFERHLLGYKTAAISLPPECLREVFEYLDKGSLYSSLLVNRSWCKVVVPLLWRSPFRTVNGPSLETAKVIQTYLTCLCEKSKAYLVSNGVILPPSTTKGPAIFDYPSFLRELKFVELYSAVSDWLATEPNESNNIYDEQQLRVLIAEQLFKLFMNRCPTFEILSLSDLSHEAPMPLVPLLAGSGADACLTGLKAFHCVSKHGGKRDIFHVMSQVSETLETMWVGGVEQEMEVKALSVFIRAQKRLKAFKYSWDYQTRLQIILIGTLDALKTQVNTLTTLHFEYCNFAHCDSLEPLAVCENLEIIQFIQCIYLAEKMRPLAKVFFPRLKTLGFYCNFLDSARYWIDPSDIAAIVKNSHKSLEHVVLPRVGNYEEGSQTLIKALRHCINIIDLRLQIRQGETKDFMEFFNNNNRLEITTFICHGDLNVEELLTQMTRRWPNTLSTLNIKGQWMITPESLKTFLKDSKSCLKHLDLHSSNHLTDDHVAAVIEYLKEMKAAKKPHLCSIFMSGDRITEKRGFNLNPWI